VFGRRPLPLTDIESLDPAAMSEDPLTEDLTNMQIQRLAIRAHMEAKQFQDLRRGIARNLRPSDGPYSPGGKVFFWEKDHSKIKDTGRWVRGRVLGQQGSMVPIETDKAVVRINQSKVRRHKDIWHDISLPRELQETPPLQDQQGPPSRTQSQPASQENPPSRINPPPGTTGGSSRDAGDYWRDDGHSWTKVHVVPRLALFVPDGSPGRPTEEQIQQRRISIVVFKDNTRQRIEDDWKETGAVELENHWTGETIFLKVGYNLPEKEAPCGVADPLTSILLGAHNDRADFLEIRHGSAQVSATFAAQGFKTTTPIDLSVGFDGSTCAGQETAWKIILESQPLLVFLTPWYEPWKDQGHHDARINKAKKRTRQQHKPQLQFCARVMKYQIQNNRFFILDGPEYSQLW